MDKATNQERSGSVRTNTRYTPPAGVVIPAGIDITVSRNFAFINDRRVGALKRSHRRSDNGVYQWHYTPECGPGVNAKADGRSDAIYQGLVLPLLKEYETGCLNLAQFEAQCPSVGVTAMASTTAIASRPTAEASSAYPTALLERDNWTASWSRGYRTSAGSNQGRVFATRVS